MIKSTSIIGAYCVMMLPVAAAVQTTTQPVVGTTMLESPYQVDLSKGIRFLAGAVPTTTQSAMEVKVSETPYLLEPSQELLLIEKPYVAIVRGTAPGLVSSLGVERVLKSLIANTPEELLPSGPTRTFLETQPDRAIRRRIVGRAELNVGGGSFRGPAWDKERTMAVHEFQIIASSPKQAEDVAKALILVYNEGYAERSRKEALATSKGEEARLPGLEAAVKKAQQNFEKIHTQVEQYDQLTDAAATAIETKQWLLSVDIAGVNARIDAVQKLLSEEKTLFNSTVQQLEEIKIRAQIDMADLLAKQAKTKSILASAQQRRALMPAYEKAKSELKRAKEDRDRCKKTIESHLGKSQWSIYQPFGLVDNTITIHPVRWKTDPAKPEDGVRN